MPIGLPTETLTASNPVAQSVTTFPNVINEGETLAYVLQLDDGAGGAILNTDFTAITLTLVDEETFVVINSRNAQDILGAGKLGDNNVVFSTAALLTWNMQALDTPVVDPTGTKKYEYHRAIFRFEYDLGLGAGPEVAIHEVRLVVKNAFSPITPL